MKTRITFVVVGLMAIVLSNVESTRADTWTQKADMPTARHGLSTSVVDGKIYAFGGTGGLKKVEEYDPATDTWTEKADIPTGRVMLSTSVVGRKIYAIGGMTVYRGNHLTTVEEYDPTTDTWTQKADMPAPRAALSTSVVNGRIYAIGGGDKRGSYTATVWEYDPATDTWTTKADKPTPTKLVPTNVVNGKIYTFGGHRPNASVTYSIVEVYDPVADTWMKKSDMPVPRAAGATSVVNGKIYAFGGYASKGGVPLSTLFHYDPSTDTWTENDDMPVRMIGMSTSVVGGRIYVIGGSSALWPYDPPLSTVWEYDTGFAIPPDFNGDGDINSTDVAILVNHWHTDNALYDIAPAPFGDDIVDVQDLIFLSEHLFEEVDDPTLIAHWALDETEGIIAADSVSENGYSDGIVVGDPVWQPASGQVDGAIQLDGVDDCIIANHVLNPADGPFSVLAWINGGAPGQVVVSQQSAANWLSIDAEGNLMTELKGTDSATDLLFSETVITDGQWHRIGFVWDGSIRMLYVDGVVVAEDTQPALNGSQMGLYIGVDKNYAAGTFFSGMIDDVRIYDRAVSP